MFFCVKWGILEEKTRDFRLNEGFEKTCDFRLDVGFSKRKHVIFAEMWDLRRENVIFKLNGKFPKRKRVIFA